MMKPKAWRGGERGAPGWRGRVLAFRFAGAMMNAVGRPSPALERTRNKVLDPTRRGAVQEAMPATPEDRYDTKARHLRALYRDGGGERAHPAVKAEFERLFPEREARLDQILVSVWKEGRALAGQWYDYGRQAWRDAEGRVLFD